MLVYRSSSASDGGMRNRADMSGRVLLAFMSTILMESAPAAVLMHFTSSCACTAGQAIACVSRLWLVQAVLLCAFLLCVMPSLKEQSHRVLHCLDCGPSQAMASHCIYRTPWSHLVLILQ